MDLLKGDYWKRHSYHVWGKVSNISCYGSIVSAVNQIGPDLEILKLDPIATAKLAANLFGTVRRYAHQKWGTLARGYGNAYGIDIKNIMAIPGYSKSYSEGERYLINRERVNVENSNPFTDSNQRDVFVNDFDKRLTDTLASYFNKDFGSVELWNESDFLLSCTSDFKELADVLGLFSEKKDLFLPGGPVPQDIMWSLMEGENCLPYKYSFKENEENMLCDEKGYPVVPLYNIIDKDNEEVASINGVELRREWEKTDFGMLYVIDKYSITGYDEDKDCKIINLSGSGAYGTYGVGLRFLTSLGKRKGLAIEIADKLSRDERDNFVCIFRTEIENKRPKKTDTLDIIPFNI